MKESPQTGPWRPTNSEAEPVVKALPRVFADFNDLLSSPDRLWLDTAGAHADLETQGLQLSVGLEVLLYDHDLDSSGARDDLVVEGIVARDRETGRWMATIDRNAIRHASDD